MGWITEKCVYAIQVFGCEESSMAHERRFCYPKPFFLSSSLSMVLHNKSIRPEVTEQEKKMDSICTMQQTAYLWEVSVVTA